MIVRILGDGQYDVPDERIGELDALDDEVQHAVETGDAETFGRRLTALDDAVRRLGTPLAVGALVPSTLILPAPDAELDDVRALLGADGLIPG